MANLADASQVFSGLLDHSEGHPASHAGEHGAKPWRSTIFHAAILG
jgi:hypothetical protein